MNALQQFLQAASNEAAGTISGPVDLIGMGLRKLGVPVPKNALMSSEWMKQNGLMQDVPQSGASLAGQTFGLLSPIAAAANSAKLARGLLQVGENAAAPRRLNPQTGAIAWHGSPHKFDQFDSSKIGTGEGAQAYGHGLYLAEAPDVARTYTADRAYVGAAMAGKPQAINYDDPAWLAQKTIDELGDPVKAKAHLEMVARTSAKHMSPESAAGVKGAIDLISSGGVAPKGNLYKVDLPDEKIARMLDWDKPLSQQSPDVQLAMEAIRESARKSLPQIATGDPTGRGLYTAYQTHRGGNQSAVSEKLRELGIPGIRYLDGGSRSAGAGSSNFVVFPGEENALKILERNGKPIR